MLEEKVCPYTCRYAQSHRNVRLFTRQLQWACQQCKRLVNHEGEEEEAEESADADEDWAELVAVVVAGFLPVPSLVSSPFSLLPNKYPIDPLIYRYTDIHITYYVRSAPLIWPRIVRNMYLLPLT